MDPKEEFIHQWPKDLEAAWKENWYFNFIDRKNRAWGINHVSLMRHTQQGRFSCVHVIDDQIIPYTNKIDIADLDEITDGKLKFDFIEPFKKFRVTFDGPLHRLDLEYDATFPVCPYDKPGGSKGQPLSVDHYRQSLKAKGTVTFKGETREVESYCDRDHTWGFRDEGRLTGWNWAGAYFPDKTFNFNRIIMGKAFFCTGYMSNAEGNTKLRVEVKDTQFEGDAPVSSVFTGYDEKGKLVGSLKTEKFCQLRLPMVDKEGVTVFENFAEFIDVETGEKADGVDEYLINPKDNFYEK